jgi:peroxiredoxin
MHDSIDKELTRLAENWPFERRVDAALDQIGEANDGAPLDNANAATRRHSSRRSNRRGWYAVAIVAASFLLIVTPFLIIPRGSAFAWDEVVDAVRAKPWMHSTWTYPGGSHETWDSPRHRIWAMKHNAFVYFHDYESGDFGFGNGVSDTYSRDAETITRTGLASVAEDYQFHHQLLSGLLRGDKVISVTPGRQKIVKQEFREVHDGDRHWVEFELHITNPGSTPDPVIAIYRIDPETRLPHSCKMKDFITDEAGTPLTPTLVFDYPEDGPRDIYALGVPRDTEVKTQLATNGRQVPSVQQADEREAVAVAADFGLSGDDSGLSADEFRDALGKRMVSIDPAPLVEFITSLDSPTPEIKALGGKLKDGVSELSFRELIPLLTTDGSQLLCAKLSTHDDPLLRFVSNVTLAGTGDANASKAIFELIHGDEMTPHEMQLLTTWCMGIGIRPATDDATKILEHLRTMMTKAAKLKPGDSAPDFVAATVSGEHVSLQEMKGKIVVMHFWSSWCAPCMTRLDSTVEELAKHPAEQVVVLFVSIDDNRAAYDKAVQAHRIPFAQILDGNGWGGPLARDFGVNHVPFDVVIDRNGKVFSNLLKDIDAALQRPRVQQ